jgi:hypothetical protein
MIISSATVATDPQSDETLDANDLKNDACDDAEDEQRRKRQQSTPTPKKTTQRLHSFIQEVEKSANDGKKRENEKCNYSMGKCRTRGLRAGSKSSHPRHDESWLRVPNKMLIRIQRFITKCYSLDCRGGGSGGSESSDDGDSTALKNSKTK